MVKLLKRKKSGTFFLSLYLLLQRQLKLLGLLLELRELKTLGDCDEEELEKPVFGG